MMAAFDTKEKFCRLANVIEYLALSLMIGGMLALGAFVAPAIFGNLPLDEAAKVMTLIFRRYDGVMFVGLILIVFGEVVRMATSDAFSRLVHRIRYVGVVLLVCLSLFSLFVVNPKIAQFQHQGVVRGVGKAGIALDQTHRQAEMLYKTELSLEVLILILLSI